MRHGLGMTESGEQCERNGLYLASGACGHATQRTLGKSELLPSCHVCGRSVTWTLLREWRDLPEPRADEEE
jgi:hypothetical protein